MALTANRIKQSLASILPKRNKLHAVSAECLSRLVNDPGKTCFLKHRCFSTLPMRPTWKRRFVILANTALYVYDETTSKCPRTCISLVGYNCVRRVDSDKSSQWPFAIASDEDPSMDVIFDCSSDQERRDWMSKIKESLYKANNVQPRKMSLVEQLASSMNGSGSVDGVEYSLLEEPVYQVETPNGTIGLKKNHLKDSVFYDESDISDYEDNNHNHNSHKDTDDDDDENYEVGIWCRLQRKGAIKKRRRHAASSESAVVSVVVNEV